MKSYRGIVDKLRTADTNLSHEAADALDELEADRDALQEAKQPLELKRRLSAEKARVEQLEIALRLACGTLSTSEPWACKHPQECYERYKQLSSKA